MEVCLSQLPAVLADPPAEYQPSNFFVEQLTAFEVWLEFGGRKETKPPVLTVVLQVLLSQAHRFRALNLLARFLDMGSWAVNHALSVGVFPYVLKLLQSPSKHIREPLIFIWAKILTVDSSCTVDLIRDTDYTYFLQCLTSPDLPPNQRALSVVILSVIVSELPEAKDKCLQGDIIIGLKAHVDSSCPHIRKWVCLCSGQLWSSYERAKSLALDQQLPQVIVTLLQDPVAEVRAAALYALGTYMRSDRDSLTSDALSKKPEHAEGNAAENKTAKTGGAAAAGAAAANRADEDVKARIDQELALAQASLSTLGDASPVVRRELTFLLAILIRRFEEGVVQVCVRAGWKSAGGGRGIDRSGNNVMIPQFIEEADGDWLSMYQSLTGGGGSDGGNASQTNVGASNSPYASNMPIPLANRK